MPERRSVACDRGGEQSACVRRRRARLAPERSGRSRTHRASGDLRELASGVRPPTGSGRAGTRSAPCFSWIGPRKQRALVLHGRLRQPVEGSPSLRCARGRPLLRACRLSDSAGRRRSPPAGTGLALTSSPRTGIRATTSAWSTRPVTTGRRAECGGAACRPARIPPTPGALSTASNLAPRGPARS